MTYEEFVNKLNKARFSWQVKKIRAEIIKSDLPNRLINSLNSQCQAKLDNKMRKRRAFWDWIRKWIWPLVMVLIALILGIVLTRLGCK